MRLAATRAHSFHFLAPSMLSLAGGARAPVFALPPTPHPLRLDDIRIIARADGFRGGAVDRVMADVMMFDAAFLAADTRKVAATINRMNR